ncbi:MAG: hypothetical protein P9M14_03805 [Candidatus Alcyoniella australis]|nr:hypothetical protein [Candidatus Alcyoniella australis]
MTALSGSKPRRAWLHALLYLLRFGAVAACLTLIVLSRLRENFPLGQSRNLMDVIVLLDLFRALFYAVLPAALLLLFAPRITAGRRPRLELLIGLPICLTLAVVSGWLPYFAARATRPLIALPEGVRAASYYVALNVFVVLWLHTMGRSGLRLRLLATRGLGAADLLAPSLVWSAVRAERGRLLEPLRVLPAVLVCATVFVPWLLHPPSIEQLGGETYYPLHPALHQLRKPPTFQVQPLETPDALLISTDQRELYRVEGRSGETLAELWTEFEFMQILAYDAAANELLFIEPSAGQSVRIDSQSMRLIERIAIENPVPQWLGNKWRTYLGDGNDPLYSFSQIGGVALDRGGRRILGSYFHAGSTSGEVYDAQRGLVHVVRWRPGGLVALDARDLKVRRERRIPNFAERINLEPGSHRLYVSLPLLGEVRVFDARDYSLIATIETFPGVRFVGFDLKGRRLLIAGFAPVIELRDLDDYSLIDRVTAPAWARWIAFVDNDALITSNLYGLWRIDLDRLGKDSTDAAWRRFDPFYTLLNRGIGLAARLIWGDDLEQEHSCDAR